MNREVRELINVSGVMTPHTVVPIIGDGACLFRGLSYLLYESQVMAREIREEIVEHVMQNWNRFSVMTHDANGDNYLDANVYHSEMSRPNTYGGLCELFAAAEIYNHVFEVYRDGVLYVSAGQAGHPVGRLRFTNNLSNGHFDVYLPSFEQIVMSPTYTDPDHFNSFQLQVISPTFTPDIPVQSHSSSYGTADTTQSPTFTQPDNFSLNCSGTLLTPDLSTPKKKKRRVRVTGSTRNIQLREAAAKYQNNNPEVHRKAVANYQKNNPEVHKTAVANYQKNNPGVHRSAAAKFQRNNPELHRLSTGRHESQQPGLRQQRRICQWQNKKKTGLAYDCTIEYEKDAVVALGQRTLKCKYCNALKWKNESIGMCCCQGKVHLPSFEPLPEPLYSLIMDLHPDHLHFMDRIRKYNSCFQMTSFGAKQVKEDGFMPTFKVQGQVYHLIGGLYPLPNQSPQFLQIYFVGEDEKEARLRCDTIPDVKEGLVRQLQSMLHISNPYIKDFKTTLDKVPSDCNNFSVVISADKKPASGHSGRYNAPTTSEVALVIVGQQFEKRDIVIQNRADKLQRISEIHRSYDTLQYPLMFCRGEDGYSINISQVDPVTKLPGTNTVSAMNFYAYRLMSRSTEDNHLLYYRALFSQFLVDMYAKIESERLNFIRNNQAQIRAENYKNLRDAIGRQDSDAAELGQMVVLPATFHGSPRYMHEKTQDAMTYVRRYGRPDLFITFTCNSHWPEIEEALLPGQKPHDRQDIIARVFHLKVNVLLSLITQGELFGTMRCYIYSVEWQKRGLPHIHLLLWLQDSITPDKIDRVISAEIPDPTKDPLLYDIIKRNMIHGPCGILNKKSPCMKAGNCTKKYPRPLLDDTQTGEDGYPKYRRRHPQNGGFTVEINGMKLDNRWVVPYNPVLSRIFQGHVNVECCNSIKSIKYVCKYVTKGSDQATFGIENEKDETKIYESGRYISSSEAVWRILAFSVHKRFPAVFPLAVHLENGQRIYFNPNHIDRLINVLDNPPKTTLTAFFELCLNDNFAKTLLYVDVPTYYVYQNGRYQRRRNGIDVVGWPGVKKGTALGRVYTVHPNNSECYYLRMLLHEIRGPTSFLDLKTINQIVYPTFQASCMALGLLENDSHWDATLEEAAVSDSPARLRELFAIMIIFCHLSDPLSLWNKHKDNMSEDISRRTVCDISDGNINVMSEVYNKSLLCLEDTILSLGGQSLQHYGLPQPLTNEANIINNRDYFLETNYDTGVLAQSVIEKEVLLSSEQSEVYKNILHSIETNSGQVFFLDAPGGTGKTFLINLLLAKVRKNRGIALAVASSGIAATLLDGGKTAHSAFKLPLNLVHTETATCNIPKQSNLAQLLCQCQLIVWDESSMAHKAGLEALSRTLKDIRGGDALMGGVTVLLAGDFRQTLPVVPRGTRADEVKACLKSSYLWPNIHKVCLTKNMRVLLYGDETAAQFSNTLLKIGSGDFPTNEGTLNIPSHLATVVSNLSELTFKLYPDIQNIKEKTIDWLCERAILTPKNNSAAEINQILIKSFEGEEMQYKSVDTVIEVEEAVHYPVEFLNSLNPSGLPEHVLKLKVGAPVMLLRNLNPPKLCNGTRLRIISLHRNVIEATVLTGSAKGESVFIPRIPLIPSDYPFQFKRLQFPLKLCFAMTINKAQGQTLRVAGVDLREDCFSHGQFYVACSRVSSASNLVILAPQGKTANVVYNEVLR